MIPKKINVDSGKEKSMVENKIATIKERVANLLSVKSLVTVTLTGVFAYLSVTGVVEGKDFMTVFLIIIAFYFGVQSTKGRE